MKKTIIENTRLLLSKYEEFDKEDFQGQRKHTIKWEGRKMTLLIDKNESFELRIKKLGIREILKNCFYLIDKKDRWAYATLTFKNCDFDEMDLFISTIIESKYEIAIQGKNLTSRVPRIDKRIIEEYGITLKGCDGDHDKILFLENNLTVYPTKVCENLDVATFSASPIVHLSSSQPVDSSSLRERVERARIYLADAYPKVS